MQGVVPEGDELMKQGSPVELSVLKDELKKYLD
jgi:hypothetical protein